MANVGSLSSQVSIDKLKYDNCDKCVELSAKLTELESKYDVTYIHNQNLIVDLSKCT
ncbi:hypothetical protein Hanom_Chr10g00952651 [Helianthus anomalus]